MARAAITSADVHEHLSEADRNDVPATARWFEELAGDPQPGDEASPSQLLIMAGEFWALAEDHERALDLYRRAVADGSPCVPDARCALVDGLLQVGSDDEANALSAEIKAERPRDPHVYVYVGEAYEAHGDLGRATQWFTSGMFLAMRDEAATEEDLQGLMAARRRVRRTAGFPPDTYDQAADQAAAQAAAQGPGSQGPGDLPFEIADA